MTREEAWRSAKECLYDTLSGEEADKIIKALEQKTCKDCVSFEAVKNTMFMVQRAAFISDNEFHRTIDLLMRLPSVTPKPKTGHWIKEKSLHGWDGKSYQCSKCLIIHSHTSIFCPSCGSKMIEEPEGEGEGWKYKAQRFDSIYYLKDFLNANKIPQKNIVGIFRKDNGFMKLLYIEPQESEDKE